MAIYFYSTIDEYGAFSNFAPYGVELDDQWWPTVEHYFQAQKFHDVNYRERIRRAHGPKQAASLGRSRAVPLRADWEAVKDEIMHKAVQKKFQTHPELCALLLQTGDAPIIENAPGDFYWGCGQDGTGRNRLGQILQDVRAMLRRKG